MTHFAQVVNGIVTNVIVAEQDVIDSGIFGDGWIQTSYNTYGGQHPEGRPLRKIMRVLTLLMMRNAMRLLLPDRMLLGV